MRITIYYSDRVAAVYLHECKRKCSVLPPFTSLVSISCKMCFLYGFKIQMNHDCHTAEKAVSSGSGGTVESPLSNSVVEFKLLQ